MSEQQVERWDGYQILRELVKALGSASTRAREESEADSPRGKGRILQALEVPGGNYPGGSGELLNLGRMWSNVHFKATPDHGRGNAFEEQEQK